MSMLFCNKKPEDCKSGSFRGNVSVCGYASAAYIGVNCPAVCAFLVLMPFRQGELKILSAALRWKGWDPCAALHWRAWISCCAACGRPAVFCVLQAI